MTENAPESIYASTNLNQSVAVVYDSQNPKVSYLAGTVPSANTAKIEFFIGVAVMVFAVLGVIGRFTVE